MESGAPQRTRSVVSLVMLMVAVFGIATGGLMLAFQAKANSHRALERIDLLEDSIGKYPTERLEEERLSIAARLEDLERIVGSGELGLRGNLSTVVESLVERLIKLEVQLCGTSDIYGQQEYLGCDGPRPLGLEIPSQGYLGKLNDCINELALRSLNNNLRVFTGQEWRCSGFYPGVAGNTNR